MRIVRWLAAIGVGVAVVLGIAWLRAAPEPPAEDSASAKRLAPGPLAVGRVDHTFVDPSRPTPANGEFAGAPERTLEGTLWYPLAEPDPHPFIVYSHGFMSMRGENPPLAELLASHGYVVASVDYPLTNGGAPGGANIADVVNQPGDVSFLIDTVTSWSEDARPFPGSIDPERIGVAGLSLGGLTTTLVSFHPRLRDPRIAGAVSIAGPSSIFTDDFFATADLPFLMIAGTIDAIVPFDVNGAPIPTKLSHGGGLLAIEGASHAGFADFADRFPLRLLANPDRLGCAALMRNLGEVRTEDNPFGVLGGPEDGLSFEDGGPTPCADGAPEEALAAGRQLMITRLATLAFFQSLFAEDGTERTTQAAYLRKTLPQDFPEASYRDAGPI